MKIFRYCPQKCWTSQTNNPQSKQKSFPLSASLIKLSSCYLIVPEIFTGTYNAEKLCHSKAVFVYVFLAHLLSRSCSTIHIHYSDKLEEQKNEWLTFVPHKRTKSILRIFFFIFSGHRSSLNLIGGPCFT